MSSLNQAQWAPGQSNPHLTVNEAIELVADALTASFAVDVSAASAIVADADFQANIGFVISGATAAGRTVTLPAIARLVAVYADTANTESVDVVVGSTTLTLAPGDGAIVLLDGTANGLISISGGGSGGGGSGDALAIRDESGSTLTLGLSDVNNQIGFSNGAGCAITVPAAASVAFTAGDIIHLWAATAGAVTVAGDTGVTVHYPSDLLGQLRAQYASASLVYRGSDVWVLTGELAVAP